MKLKAINTMNNIERAELLFTLIPADRLQPTTRRVAQAIYLYADFILQREDEVRKAMENSNFTAGQWLQIAADSKVNSRRLLDTKSLSRKHAAETLFSGLNALFSAQALQQSGNDIGADVNFLIILLWGNPSTL